MATATANNRAPESWLRVVWIAVAFIVTQQLGLLLAFPSYNATPMWLASGLGVGLILRFQRDAIYGIGVGAMASNGYYFFSVGALHPAVLAFVAANILEPVIAAGIATRLGRPRKNPTVRFAACLVLAGLVGSLASALIGVPASWWAGFAERSAVMSGMLYWWLGNWAGIVVVAPVVLTLVPFPSPGRYMHRFPGFLVFFVGTLMVLLGLFSDTLIQTQIHSLSYLILVALFYGIFRRSFTEVIWTQLVVVLVAIIATLNGKGPFVAESQELSLLLLQIFLIVVTSLSLVGAAGTSERAAIDRALQRAKERLEDRVEQRTADLKAALEREQQLVTAVEYQARHDPLTGLYNRYVFEEELTAMVDAVREDSEGGAIAYLDLDRFKVVNDTCGHAAGDELLRQLGGLIDDVVEEHTLARLGGDEFGLLMPGCDLNQAHQTVDAVLDAIRRFRFDWEDQSFHIGACAGIAAVGNWTTSAQSVMSLADAACYAAKEGGRNRVKVYRPGDAEFEKMKSEAEWVERLIDLLEREALELECQRIHSLEDPSCWRGEVLVRLRDSDGKLVPPAEFIGVAERNDLGPELDRKVLKATLATLSRFRPELDRLERLGINLSGQSLTDPSFLQFARDAIRESMVPPDKIEFEVTETAAIARLSAARHFMEDMRKIGCRFSLDEFGSGLSSFAYLRALTVDTLKIDGVFVRELARDSVDHAIIEAIQKLADALDLETVAEFVENERVLTQVREIGVSHVQGFHLDRPRPLEELLMSMCEGKPDRASASD